MTGTIQGSNAILSFYNGDYVPFVCASDISVELTSDELPIRAVGGGHWKDFTYNNAGYTISLSGLLKFDDTNISGFDLIENWLNFAAVDFLITFDDQNGNVKSLEGQAMIKGNTLSWSAGALVKTDISLTGKGELLYFDGIIPCNSGISSITATETGSTGDITIGYVYSSAPYQVKYRVDNAGKWFYSLIGVSIALTGLSIGSHSIEIIPICVNGYEGTGLTQTFNITQTLTCSSVISDITITSTSATPVYSGTPAGYFVVIDGSSPVYVLIGQSYPLGSLSVGSHTINMTPECSNGITGTGFTKTFTVSSQPSQSAIAYDFTQSHVGNSFQIYVNGVLTVSASSNRSGTIYVPNGAAIRTAMTSVTSTNSLVTVDTSTSTTLNSQSSGSLGTLQYIFNTNGDNYSITASTLP